MPVSPRTKLNVLLGLLVGLGLGVGLAVLRDSFDKTIKSKDHAQNTAQAPVLTAVHEDPEADEHRLITHDPFSVRAEAFRQLRTNIRFLSVDHAVRSLVVTSSVPSEGKTSTAANLAIAMAQAGEDVVLIDADLRRPTIADVFTLSSGVGLTSVLLGDLALDEALQPWRPDLPLKVLTAGPIPPNPAELIGSARMKALIGELTDAGITVVLDSPPLLPVTDAALLARASDGALVVTRAASTHVEQLAEATQALRTAGANVLGVVLNRIPRKKGSGYYGGYDAYRGYRSTTASAVAHLDRGACREGGRCARARRAGDATRSPGRARADRRDRARIGAEPAGSSGRQRLTSPSPPAPAPPPGTRRPGAPGLPGPRPGARDQQRPDDDRGLARHHPGRELDRRAARRPQSGAAAGAGTDVPHRAPRPRRRHDHQHRSSLHQPARPDRGRRRRLHGRLARGMGRAARLDQRAPQRRSQRLVRQRARLTQRGSPPQLSLPPHLSLDGQAVAPLTGDRSVDSSAGTSRDSLRP